MSSDGQVKASKRGVNVAFACGCYTTSGSSDSRPGKAYVGVYCDLYFLDVI